MDRAEVNEAFEDVCKTTYKCMKITTQLLFTKQWVKLLGNCVKHLTCTDSSPPQPTYSHDYGSTHFTGEKTEAQSCSVTVLVKVQSRDLTRSCSPVN